jgi:hypothetical protein
VVSRHAGVPVSVDLHLIADRLRFSVVSGAHSLPASAYEDRLRDIRDRVQAVGGDLGAFTSDASATVLSGWVPVAAGEVTPPVQAPLVPLSAAPEPFDLYPVMTSQTGT